MILDKKNITKISSLNVSGFIVGAFVGAASFVTPVSYAKLDPLEEDLLKFKELPDNINPIAYLYSCINLYLNSRYSSILIYEQNNELFFHQESTYDNGTVQIIREKKLSEIDLSQQMNEYLVSFCQKIQLNFELTNKFKDESKTKNVHKI